MLWPVLAMPADIAPETVAQATSEATKVTWAWGATVSQWAGSIMYGIAALVIFLFNKLPA